MAKAKPPVRKNIELRVRLSDGSFDTSLELPVEASKESREALVESWFLLMRRALAVATEQADV